MNKEMPWVYCLIDLTRQIEGRIVSVNADSIEAFVIKVPVPIGAEEAKAMNHLTRQEAAAYMDIILTLYPRWTLGARCARWAIDAEGEKIVQVFRNGSGWEDLPPIDMPEGY
jgi:hypothetical protein